MQSLSQIKLLRAFIESHLHPMGIEGTLCYSFCAARPASVFVHYLPENEAGILNRFREVPNLGLGVRSPVGSQISLELFFSGVWKPSTTKYIEQYHECPIPHEELTKSQLYSKWGVIYPEKPHRKQGEPCGELRYYTQSMNDRWGIEVMTHEELHREIKRASE